MIKHFLSIDDYSAEEIQSLLEQTVELKELYKEGGRDLCMAGKTMVMIFEKPSARTRISFQVAATQLGGSSIYTRPEDVGGLGQREPIPDLARVLNGYVDMIVVRTFSHEKLKELANHSTVPVINALDDDAHPCQAMADILTIQEHFGDLKGLKVAYVGDGNNVAISLAQACACFDVEFAIATPEGYAIPDNETEKLNELFKPGQMNAMSNPYDAVKGADIIYTDTWVSMGQEAEKEQRIKVFKDYQVDMALLKAAKPETKVMHCLPAYRGLEISDEVIESPQSIVFDQAENRLHFQRALMKYLLTQD